MKKPPCLIFLLTIMKRSKDEARIDFNHDEEDDACSSHVPKTIYYYL